MKHCLMVILSLTLLACQSGPPVERVPPVGATTPVPAAPEPDPAFDRWCPMQPALPPLDDTAESLAEWMTLSRHLAGPAAVVLNRPELAHATSAEAQFVIALAWSQEDSPPALRQLAQGRLLALRPGLPAGPRALLDQTFELNQARLETRRLRADKQRHRARIGELLEALADKQLQLEALTDIESSLSEEQTPIDTPPAPDPGEH